MSQSFILTHTKKKFSPENPQLDQICLQDIAHALSFIGRFCGHTDHFYSVAQHSLLLAKRLQQDGYSNRIQLIGLLHDASEAYFQDILSPLKKLLPDYQEREGVLMDVIWSCFGIRPTAYELDVVHQYDRLMLAFELKKYHDFDRGDVLDEHVPQFLPDGPGVCKRQFFKEVMRLHTAYAGQKNELGSWYAQAHILLLFEDMEFDAPIGIDMAWLKRERETIFEARQQNA